MISSFEELFEFVSHNPFNNTLAIINKDSLSNLWDIVKQSSDCPYILKSLDGGKLYICLNRTNNMCVQFGVLEYIDSFHYRDSNYADRVKNTQNKEVLSGK